MPVRNRIENSETFETSGTSRMGSPYSLERTLALDEKPFVGFSSVGSIRPLILSKRPVKNMVTTRDVPP